METSIKGKVAFFMNSNYKFFSGGKYHALLLAAALSKQDIPVTVLTERPSPVLREFEGMFEVITSERWEKEIEIDPDQFEFIVGVPFDAAERAKFFAKRFFKQSILLVFDVPNWEYEMKTPGKPIPVSCWIEKTCALRPTCSMSASLRYLAAILWVCLARTGSGHLSAFPTSATRTSPSPPAPCLASPA